MVRWLCSARSVTSNNGHIEEMQERLMHMERILQHKFKDISLDTKNLAQMARSLPHNLTSKHSPQRNVPDIAVEDSEDLAMEEEKCTIEPVEQTTTRSCIYSISRTATDPFLDYSGEFSYWNFSMRIKRHIDNHLPRAQSSVGLINGREICLYNVVTDMET